MKRVLALALLAAAALSGCSSQEADTVLLDKPWQVIGIYTSDNSPSVIPQAITEPPSLTFGTKGIVGSSGCAQFRARAEYTQENKRAYIADADAFTLKTVEWRPMDVDCQGEQLWAHQQFTRLIDTGHVFAIKTIDDNQLSLTLQDGRAALSPSLRLVSLEAADPKK